MHISFLHERAFNFSVELEASSTCKMLVISSITVGFKTILSRTYLPTIDCLE